MADHRRMVIHFLFKPSDEKSNHSIVRFMIFINERGPD